MSGKLTVDQLTATVDGLAKRAAKFDGASPELPIEIDTAIAAIENELHRDRTELANVEQQFAARYSSLGSSNYNPYNWVFETDGHAEWRQRVQPLKAEVGADTLQLARARAVRETAQKRTVAFEQREMVDTLQALTTKYSKDVAVNLTVASTETGISRVDIAKSYETLLPYFDDYASWFARSWARIDSASAATGARISIHAFADDAKWFAGNVAGSVGGGLVTEAFYERLRAAESRQGHAATPAEREAIRSSVKDDFAFFYQSDDVDNYAAALLTRAINPNASRDQLMDSFDWFYGQSGTTRRESAELSVLAAKANNGNLEGVQADIIDSRAELIRLREGSCSGWDLSQIDGALAAYNASPIDVPMYNAYATYFESKAPGSGGSLADAAVARMRRLGLRSRIQ